MKAKTYRWWHGAAFFAGVRICSWGLKAIAKTIANRRATSDQDREFYRAERLPVFAPPPLAFPIAWTINNVSAIAGGLHVLNLPAGTPGRDEFLKLQAAGWCIFCAFEAGYFGLRSPVNAAVITLLYSAVTGGSIHVAVNRMNRPEIALSLVTTAVWLALANPLGLTQAAWNRDPFWNVGPFAEPNPRWLKSAA